MKLLTIRLSSLFLALCLLALPFTANAASKSDIDAKVKAAMDTLYTKSDTSRAMANRAVAILVFPDINKASILIGGTEYGEGALLEGGNTTAYYSTHSTSVGPQFGGQVKTQVYMFMTKQALNDFRDSVGTTTFGADGGVAILDMSPRGRTDPTKEADAPVLSYTYSSKGFIFGAGVEGTTVKRINTIQLSGVNFALDSADLTPASMAILDNAVGTLNQRDKIDVEVAAHTCSIGNSAYNQDLSERRAESVMKYLVSQGISAADITAKGYGATQPVGNNDTREGRAENRRVELRMLE